MRKYFLLLLCVLAASALQATKIEFTSNINDRFLADSSGIALPNGSLVWIGTFDNLVEIKNRPVDELIQAAGWSLFGSIATDDIMGNPGKLIDGVVDSSPSADAFNGKPIFLWVFNAPIVGAATEFGIYSSMGGDWVYPDNGTLDFLVLSLQDPNLISYFGSVTSGALRLSTIVPEPAAYAAGAAVALMAVVGLRGVRRRIARK